MDQNSANLDLSSSQRAYLHEAVPAEDGSAQSASFPTAALLEAHALVHANAEQTPNAIDNFPTAAGHKSAHTPRLHHDLGYPPQKTYSTPAPSVFGTTPIGNYDPTPSLFGNVYDTPTGYYDPTAYLSRNVYEAPPGFYDPNPGWLNPFNAVGTRGYDYTDPVHNMPSSTFTTINEGTFTQGFGHSGIASHDPYYYGHSQPMPSAPPLNHAVDQTSNTFNNTAPALARPTCMQCGRDFGRQADLNRHMKRHQPDAQVFRCQVEGCQYSSIREDKLKEHSRCPH